VLVLTTAWDCAGGRGRRYPAAVVHLGLQRTLKCSEEVAHVQEAVGLRAVVSAAFLVCITAVRVHKVRLGELGWRLVRRGERWALDRGTWVTAAGVVGGCDAACVEFSIGCCFGLECDLLQRVMGITGIDSIDKRKNGGGQEEEEYDG